jgi:uncharacterized protein (DUF1810 family)
MRGADPFDPERFVSAQQAVIEQVRAELRAGRKRSHWMWFVFPQLRGLGHSATAQHYGIASIEEAKAYLAHPVLGPRLRECCELMLQVPGESALEILGSPDDLKFRSCLTLFGVAAPGEEVFGRCLERFFEGRGDERTVTALG